MTHLAGVVRGGGSSCLRHYDALRTKIGSSPKKHSKFQYFEGILYCGMTRLRSTNLDVFIKWQYTRTILRKKNVGQSLFKTHSEFLIFNKVFYCDMAKRGHK